MDSVSYIDVMRLDVSDHAMWRAAERFPGFDVALIDREVRDAIKARRISHDRRVAGLTAGWSSTDDRFCWTEDGERVYAVRLYPERAAVMTTMRRRQEGA